MSLLKALLAALVLVSAALATLPSVPAQASGTTDPSGDVQMGTGVDGGRLPVAGLGNAVDLTSFAVVEDDDSFSFVLGVADLKDPADSSAEYVVGFTWRGVGYAAIAQRYHYGEGALGSGTFGFLGLLEDESQSIWNIEGVAPLVLAFDEAAKTVTIEVEKVYVLDKDQRPPTKGEDLEDIFVRATRTFLGIMLVGSGDATGSFLDRLPDEGTLTYTLVEGDEATGDIALKSYDRIRVSNGGATTFVYQAVVSNAGDADAGVKLSLEDLPDGWNGTVQERVVVPAGSQIWFPVFATVPFGHDHGGFSAFTVRAVSERDAASMATLRLGVLHTPIPQPAGHHDELYLHPKAPRETPLSAVNQGTYRAGMSTVADHAGELKEVAAATWTSAGMTWPIPLDPGLQMGLDFDLERTGTLTGALIGRWTGDATLSAQLLLVPAMLTSDDQYYYYDWGDGIVLAESDEATVTIAMQDPTEFTLTLTPTEESDYVPYMDGMNLLLLVSLDAPSLMLGDVGSTATRPTLLTEAFKMELPLNEYHDQLPSTSEVASGLSLRALGDVEKPARPGTLMAYEFMLKNEGSSESAIEIDLAGARADLGELAPSGLVTLAPGEERRVVLGVRVPDGSAAGEIIEVLVFAHARDDPSKMAIARTATVVTEGADAVPDEAQTFAAAQNESNDTPAPGAVLVLAALALVALVLRRR